MMKGWQRRHSVYSSYRCKYWQ